MGSEGYFDHCFVFPGPTPKLSPASHTEILTGSAPDELYASKLVAALDRQHPRDLFDVWQLFESGDISDGMVECFVVYLAGHNRPPHEVLFGNDKDIAGEYERAFVGMTEVDCSLETLLDARARMRRELPQRLSTASFDLRAIYRR